MAAPPLGQDMSLSCHVVSGALHYHSWCLGRHSCGHFLALSTWTYIVPQRQVQKSSSLFTSTFLLARLFIFSIELLAASFSAHRLVLQMPLSTPSHEQYYTEATGIVEGKPFGRDTSLSCHVVSGALPDHLWCLGGHSCGHCLAVPTWTKIVPQYTPVSPWCLMFLYGGLIVTDITSGTSSFVFCL